MSKWTLEPGHTGVEFCVRHMMVTLVRGHFKDVHGKLEFDPENPLDFSVEATMDAKNIWTGEPDRDDHLRSADFLDVEHFPVISFKGNQVEINSPHEYTFKGDLTLHGITRPAILEVRYLGQWETPWWEDDEDKGPITRAGFIAKTKLSRHDFGISWNSDLEKGGIVVGNRVDIIIDAEAIKDS